jgi:hypothetical protein
LKNYTQIPTIAINNILDGEMSEKEKNISSNYIVRNNETDYLKKGFDKWSDVYDQVERIHNSLSKKIPQTILGD